MHNGLIIIIMVAVLLISFLTLKGRGEVVVLVCQQGGNILILEEKDQVLLEKINAHSFECLRQTMTYNQFWDLRAAYRRARVH